MRGKSQKDKVLEQLQKQRRQQTRSKDNAITSLEFSGIQIDEFTPSVDEYLKSFPNLENVAFKRCKIQSLNGLSENKKILQLNLEENQLDDACIKQIVQNFPSLVVLNLKKNQIKEFNELEELKKLSQLTHLSLDKNPVKETNDFIKQVWELLSNLKALDGLNSDNKVVKEKEEYYDEDDEDEDDDDEEEEIDDDDESFSMGEEDDDDDYSEAEDSESYSNKKKNQRKKVKK